MRCALALALLLAGCSSDSDPAPGGVTKGEAKQLDAAATLDQRPAAPLVDATVPVDSDGSPGPKQ
jgi:PBP1b-binding outer membrane lipoprotein LpoB